MKDLQYYYTRGLGVLLIAVAIVLSFWLVIMVMLHGGILQAVTGWGVDDSAVVWGIIRAIFCEIGLLPGYLLFRLGSYLFFVG